MPHQSAGDQSNNQLDDGHTSLHPFSQFAVSYQETLFYTPLVYGRSIGGDRKAGIISCNAILISLRPV